MENNKEEKVSESEYRDMIECRERTISSFPTSEIYHGVEPKYLNSRIQNYNDYLELYNESIREPEAFWKKLAEENINWISPFDKVLEYDNKSGLVAWFLNGKLNVCYNCIDRWLPERKDDIAIIYEGDNPLESKTLTFNELYQGVCRFSNMLKSAGVRKRDVVTIYLPMSFEIAYAMLGCSRIGAVHNVVFGGYSSLSLADRIINSKSEFLVTADFALRGGKTINLGQIAHEVMKMEGVKIKKCFFFKRDLSCPISMKPERDIEAGAEMMKQSPYCPLEPLDSEDPLFILYTSGSTGKPKGVIHTGAGYLLYTMMTHRYVFDIHQGDRYACVADCGWITGHSYVIYGPLSNGVSTFIFESVPTYPDCGRYWSLVEKHGLTHLYVAPTAIRLIMKDNNDYYKKYDLSSLRIIGSVGEPINPEAWRWLYRTVLKEKCTIVDTYWQTETGGHLIAPIPYGIHTKPGCAGVPFFGIEPVLLDCNDEPIKEDSNVHGLLCVKNPWPGMMRTIVNNHELYVNKYISSNGYYITGDGAYRDDQGFYWITGRIDDVMNISGHRISTAEVEHALTQHEAVAEAAVVGVKHSVKGTGMFCFVVLKDNQISQINSQARVEMAGQMKMVVRKYIGRIATPDTIFFSPGLPKTRSGKIMRRILRLLANQKYDSLGDTTTLANHEIIQDIIDEIQNFKKLNNLA